MTEGDDLPKTSEPAKRALAEIGVTTLSHVEQMTERELLDLHGVGPKAVRIMKETLASQGRSLRGE